MKTAREIGYAYAEWGHTEKQDGFDGPVDVNAMLGGSVDIPEGDYAAMIRHGITPDARQYWEGYNSYFASLGASMMGRKGGKSRSDAKTAAARANAMKGGRKHPDRKTYWIASGEGERGKWNKHIVTLAGAKRIATRERCGGDRWARIYEEIPETKTTRAYIIEIDGDDIREVPTV